MARSGKHHTEPSSTMNYREFPTRLDKDQLVSQIYRISFKTSQFTVSVQLGQQTRYKTDVRNSILPRSDASAAVHLKSPHFWVVALRWLAVHYRRFETPYQPHLQGSRKERVDCRLLKMEQVRCPETSVINYQPETAKKLIFLFVTESGPHQVYPMSTDRFLLLYTQHSDSAKNNRVPSLKLYLVMQNPRHGSRRYKTLRNNVCCEQQLKACLSGTE